MSTSQRTLLLAGGGYADIPLIKEAKNLGYRVITTGNRPDELGHRHSDGYVKADFSDFSAMLSLAEDLDVSAVCPCCNDFSVLSCSYVAEKLGLPGHDSLETAQIIHHKDRFRRFALEHDIPVPETEGIDSLAAGRGAAERLGFPLIIKPIDLTGGKGISTVGNEGQLEDALKQAFAISRAKRVVIEKFIEGTRHGFSAFLRDGKIVFFMNDNEHYYLNPFLVSAASTPSIAPAKAEDKLVAASERMASLLNLKDGIFHIQYILHNQDPVIIEICRRAPGDLYIELVRHATGVEYANYIVRAAAGLSCADLTHAPPRGYFTRHCIMPSSDGTLKDIRVAPQIKQKIIDEMLWWATGEEFLDPLIKKFGIVFVEFDSREEMLELTERLPDLIYPVIEPGQRNR